MSINIQAKTDYSALFSNLNTNNNSSDLTSLLTDYSGIKNGSYGKLMKAYYAKESASSADGTAKKKSGSEEISESSEAKALNKVNTQSEALQTSIDALSKVDSINDEEALSAAKDYVKKYNSFLTASSDASSSNISTNADTVKVATSTYSKQLSGIGITTGSDGKLTLDEDTFKSADKSEVASLFKAKGSYGYSVKVAAQMAASNSNYELSKTSLYNSDGSYNLSTGTMLDSLM